jgi:hypothetical protein
MKHITEMTVKEVVELYLSGVELSIEDDTYAQEFFWDEISKAYAIKNEEERARYLQTLDYIKQNEDTFVDLGERHE